MLFLFFCMQNQPITPEAILYDLYYEFFVKFMTELYQVNHLVYEF